MQLWGGLKGRVGQERVTELATVTSLEPFLIRKKGDEKIFREDLLHGYQLCNKRQLLKMQLQYESNEGFGRLRMGLGSLRVGNSAVHDSRCVNGR